MQFWWENQAKPLLFWSLCQSTHQKLSKGGRIYLGSWSQGLKFIVSEKLWLQMAVDVGGEGEGEEGTLTLTLHILEGQEAKADTTGMVQAIALKGRSSATHFLQ